MSDSCPGRRDLRIWWTSQEDCELIGDELPESVPEYIRTQYSSRYGRHGRGRLWVAPELGPAAVWPWPDTPFAVRLAERYAGIVIRAEDAAAVSAVGVLTDLHAEPLWRVIE